MADDYFSDREIGPIPQIHDELPDPAWGGLVALYRRALEEDAFGFVFPEQCPDGGAVAGADGSSLSLTLGAEIPSVELPLTPGANPGAMVAMDLVEFVWRNIAEPTQAGYHSYFSHHHLDFDQAAGRRIWREDVNRILQRNGVALELGPGGRAERVGPSSARLVLDQELPTTGDDVLDDKLAAAVKKYRDPDPAVRRESLEPLWDALERIKTLLDPDKKKGVCALVGRMAASPPEVELLDAEFSALTEIGNSHHIRHYETDKHPIDDTLVDYLFVRAYALLDSAVRAMER